MWVPPLKQPDDDPIIKDQRNRERRKVLQKQYEEEYQQALVDIKEKYNIILFLIAFIYNIIIILNFIVQNELTNKN